MSNQAWQKSFGDEYNSGSKSYGDHDSKGYGSEYSKPSYNDDHYKSSYGGDHSEPSYHACDYDYDSYHTY